MIEKSSWKVFTFHDDDFKDDFRIVVECAKELTWKTLFLVVLENPFKQLLVGRGGEKENSLGEWSKVCMEKDMDTWGLKILNFLIWLCWGSGVGE